MRCIVHIGTEKTGTTTLQRWLYANRDILSQQGYFLSGVAGVPNNRDLCAFCQSGFDDYFRSLGISTFEEKDAHFEGFRDRFGAEVEAAAEAHHTLILTSEHFSSRLKPEADVAALRDLLAGFFEDVQVVCYVREQSELIRSLYSTALLSGATVLPLAEYYEVPAVTDPFFNYALMLTPWRAVFGVGQMHVRIYARAALVDGDIRRDFATTFMADVAWDSLSHEEEAANQSMSLLHSVLIRFLNSYLPRYRQEGGLNDERLSLVQRILANPRLSAGRLSRRDANEVYASFDACNRDLAGDFLDSDENPFPAPTKPTDSAVSSAGFGQVEAEELLSLLLQLFEEVHQAESLSVAAEFSTASVRLEPTVVDFLRDLAFKYETGEQVSRSEALLLMRWAQRGRADGFHINRFLDEHSGS